MALARTKAGFPMRMAIAAAAALALATKTGVDPSNGMGAIDGHRTLKGGPAHTVHTGCASARRAARTRRNIRARASKRRGAA